MSFKIHVYSYLNQPLQCDICEYNDYGNDNPDHYFYSPAYYVRCKHNESCKSDYNKAESGKCPYGPDIEEHKRKRQSKEQILKDILPDDGGLEKLGQLFQKSENRKEYKYKINVWFFDKEIRLYGGWYYELPNFIVTRSRSGIFKGIYTYSAVASFSDIRGEIKRTATADQAKMVYDTIQKKIKEGLIKEL